MLSIPKITTAFTLVVCFQAQLLAQKNTEAYIQQYDSIAIKEMERSGIPASITLAQGIHESSSGVSELATEANNHFGIKCTSDWKGEGFHKWDDDPQKSCFRVYESAEQSYCDHTEFLMKRKHYAFLFKYPPTDYKSWAYGLRKAGYASDPNYPSKLITTIEKYKLHRYDTMGVMLITFADSLMVLTPLLVDDSDTAVLNASDNQTRKLRTKPRSFLFTSYKKGFFNKNNASYVIAQQDESPLGVATRFGIPYKKLLKFNDMREGDKLILYQYTYIQPKKASYKGEEQFHKVQQDETMYEIAQYYGIRLDALLHRNYMYDGQEPQNGEIIMLKEKAVAAPKLRPANYTEQLPPAPQDTTQEIRPVVVETTDVVVKTVPRPEPEPLKDNSTYSDQIYQQNINTVKPEDTIRVQPNVPEKTNTNSTNTTTNTLNNNALFGNPTPRTDTISKPKETIKPNPIFTQTTPVDSKVVTNNSTTKPTTIVTDTSKIKQPTPTPPVQQPLTHTVEAGDSLGKIAIKYGVSVQAIKTANNLQSDKILLKQVLKIPKNQ